MINVFEGIDLATHGTALKAGAVAFGDCNGVLNLLFAFINVHTFSLMRVFMYL